MRFYVAVLAAAIIAVASAEQSVSVYWQFTTHCAADSGFTIPSAAQFPDNYMYVGTCNGVQALSNQGGYPQWFVPFTQDVPRTFLLGNNQNLVVVTRGGSVLNLATADGGTLWSFIPSTTGTSGVALGASGDVYVNSGTTMTRINASTGAVVWSSVIPGARSTASPSDPISQFGLVFVSWSSGVTAFDSDSGSIAWTLQTKGTPFAPGLCNGTLIAVTDSGNYYAVKAPSGIVELQYSLYGYPYQGATLSANGNHLILQNNNNTNVLTYRMSGFYPNQGWNYTVGSTIEYVYPWNGQVAFTSADGNVYALDTRQGGYAWSWFFEDPQQVSTNNLVFVPWRQANGNVSVTALSVR